MPLSSLRCCCSGGTLVLTAALTLLLVPSVPDLVTRLHDDDKPRAHVAPPLPRFSVERLRALCPPLDLFATVIMLVVGFLIYLCEWIQRKLMERRIVKVNKYLLASVERLRAWDAQQEQVESTLRLVQGAAGEYNLLLFLLLRRRRASPACPARPACYLDKDLDDDRG
ncbi:hypothetical protein MSG28_008370 [Choristoneura fumiferana]|uniref:Uncharacterized protein n=1 Tax=Choristoneura fumiferana TaxID=7141 RepID=A0ACC0J621_CHOFU|nr:hypothetical protein MSG28_008370 [Choristoneura fumiferana]